MELNHYHQKVTVGVASQVLKRLMTQDLKKTKNFKKSPEMLGNYGKYPSNHPKRIL